MALENDSVELRFDDIIASNPIECDMKLYDVNTLKVYYGNSRLIATPGSDYAIVLDEVDTFNSFAVTPTPALLVKINALIALMPGEENVIFVRRELDFLSNFLETDAFLRIKISQEFDRTLMRMQQIKETAERGVLVPLGETGIVTPTTDDRAGKIWGWDNDGNIIAVGDSEAIDSLLTDVQALVTLTLGYKNAAEAASTNATAKSVLTAADRVQTGLDRTQTGLDRTQTGADRVQTGLDRTQTGADRTTVAADKATVAADKASTHTDKLSADADAIATAADRVQTGLDRVQTGLDRVQTVTNAGAAAASAASAAASAAQSLYRDIVTLTFANSPFTPTNAQEGTLFQIDTSGGNFVVNLSSLATYAEDEKFAFVKTTGDANTITVNRGGTDTIEGNTSSILGTQYEVTLFLGDSATGLWLKVIHASGVADKSITFAKIQDVATATLFGRIAAGAGSAIALSIAQVKTLLGYVAADIPTLAPIANPSFTTKISTPRVVYTSVVGLSPAADQNNYALGGAYLTALGPTANITISGFDASQYAAGEEIEIQNQSGFTITILNQSGLSTAANRVSAPLGRSLVLNAFETVRLYLGSYWLVVGRGSGGVENRWNNITKLSDESRTSNTTATDDAALKFNVSAGKRYVFRGKIYIQSPNSGGYKFGWTGPTAPVYVRYGSIRNKAGTLSAGTPYTGAYMSGGGANEANSTGGNVIHDFILDGIIEPNVSSGVMALQWAQDVANATPSTILKGSYIEYMEVV